jgi:hypothetical protein
MHRYRLPAAAVIASVLALGCGDQQPPTAPGVPGSPALSVDRHTEHFGFGFGDDRYLIIVGGTAENWANFCATGQEIWDPWSILTVVRPDGSYKETWVGDDQNALIWELPADPCAEPPDYIGTARTLLTDSDVDLSGRGVDASGVRVSGRVTDASGQLYRLMGTFLLTVPVQYTSLDNFVIIWRVQKVQLTPVGR